MTEKRIGATKDDALLDPATAQLSESAPASASASIDTDQHMQPGSIRAPWDSRRRLETLVEVTQRTHALWGDSTLQRAVDAAGIALWRWNVNSDHFEMDERGYELWGVRAHETLTFECLSARIHPSDMDRVRAAFQATRNVVGSFEIDFRTSIGEDVRWISARGRGNDEDIVRRTMFGIFLDVTGRKQAEESSELLASEMSHRVKNLLAIASALARITSRSSSDVADMTSQLTHRLTALGRAHDLVRPLPGDRGAAALLGDIFTVLLDPYEEKGVSSDRIRISLPRMGVGENAAEALALIVHELATNSLKYGALSSDDGALDVSGCVVGENVRIVWTERGGPEVASPPGKQGYGGKLVCTTVEGSLGGTINYVWLRSGVLITVEVDAERMAL